VLAEITDNHVGISSSQNQKHFPMGVPANYYQLQFESVTDAGIEEETLKARREKERRGARFRGAKSVKIKTD